MEVILNWLIAHGPQSLFVLLVLGIVGLPIPDETLLTFSGYLIWSGRFQPLETFSAALAGSVCGITISYMLGRWLGHAAIVRYGPRVGLTRERWLMVESWFTRIGCWTLTIGYYIAGVRHFTAVVAGAAELNYVSFAGHAYLGGLLWVSTFLGLGYVLGESWKVALEYAHAGSLVLLALLIVAAGAGWWWWRRRGITPAGRPKDGPSPRG
jgi:membrane protein DedA with SNARE-associated domain